MMISRTLSTKADYRDVLSMISELLSRDSSPRKDDQENAMKWQISIHRSTNAAVDTASST